jgi:hypothetical protein
MALLFLTKENRLTLRPNCVYRLPRLSGSYRHAQASLQAAKLLSPKIVVPKLLLI